MAELTEQEYVLLRSEWYCVNNNLYGGWTITTAEAALLSDLEVDLHEGRVFIVAECWSEATGKWICQLHNLFVNILNNRETVVVDRSKGAHSPDPS